MSKSFIRAIALSVVAAVTMGAGAARAATDILWWHAMSGANNDIVEALAKNFNESQSDYRVVPVYKGTYDETLNAGIAAFRARKPPAIIQVFDVGTGVMMAAEGAIRPAADVLDAGGFKFDKSRYLPAIVAYYSKPDGTLLSFPFNSSSPVMYYNTDIMKKAGIDLTTPPKTWKEVYALARKVKESGAAPCGMTSSWMTWIQTENFAALNNTPYSTNENGLAGGVPELKVDSPLFVKHLQELADLSRDGVFRYGGRTSEAKQLFISGQCAITAESSGGLADVVKAGIPFVTGPLPYDETAPGAPQNTIPGGASLWVFEGLDDAQYKGVASFFNYLSQTPVQVKLHQQSGYLPVTLAAYEETKKSGFYDKNPAMEIPILQLTGRTPTENSKGVRLPNLPAVRTIENEEYEAMFAGKQDAAKTLANIVSRGNAAIVEATSN